MEYCITTDFDLLETIKIISPWLLALVVYIVWHLQKEKEVIANETKDILKIIDEFKASYTILYVQYHIYINNNKLFDIDDFQQSKDKNYKIEKEFSSKIEFLLTLIEDKDISEIYEKIKLNEAKFSATQLLFEDQKEVDYLRDLSERLEKDLNQLKVKLASYAMYKNKIHAKSA